MQPKLDDDTKKYLTSLTKRLGITYPTMKRYIKTGEFSAEVCLNVERVTNGRITCNQLRPDLFEGLVAEKSLSDVCLDQFESLMECQNYKLIIGVLDFMEVRQPLLYREMIDHIKSLEGGELFVAQRLAHRRHGKV